MAHMLDFSTGKAAIAFAGETPWHRHGQPAQADWALDQWIDNAGIGFVVERVPAFAMVDGVAVPVDGAFFNRRTDTGAILGTETHTDRRVEVQARELAAFVDHYVSVDSRFKMQVMGAIKGGSQIWATASFDSDLTIGGEKHQAYLLARTSFDGSTGTILQMTTVKAVCNNTLSAAYTDKRAMVNVRHTTRFDADVAAKQLAALAQSVETYKQVGDAMAADLMSKEQVSAFFKSLLDIPADVQAADVSTRKMNQFRTLADCYGESVREGAATGTSWSALQAVTRYADHERTARGDDSMSEDSKRFLSSQFGSGESFKGKAMQLLLPRIKEKILIAA